MRRPSLNPKPIRRRARTLSSSGLLLAAACGLLACGEGETDDAPAIDYRAINEAAEGQAAPIVPDLMDYALLVEKDLLGAGCSFMHDDGERMWLIANGKAAHFFLDGELLTLAARPEGAVLPYGVTDRYDGREYALQVNVETDSAEVVSQELTRYRGEFVIRDPKRRIVFDRGGVVECGA